ncbi:hypothetical protein [Amycolatopsis sp.]|uniref:phage tail protein n=1 Tax=Amycolatopsis sp. TaxID=37632 RepID=UPI002C234664|nr:hypothetical protein [Amycolatopsis sp.]HVV11575.1 hypothetical protein [Amycolatopsis sp.]
MAKGPGTKNTVGKVGVRVVPDTSKFPEELKAQLEKIEQRMKVEIPVDLDTEKASAEFKALKEKLEAQSINARVNIDQSAIGRVTKSLGSISKNTNVFAGIANNLRNIGSSAERAARSVVQMRQNMAASVAQTVQWVGWMARAALSAENMRTAWTSIRLAMLGIGDAVSKIPNLASLAKDLALTGRIAGMLAVDKVQAFGKALVSAKTYTSALKTAMTGVGVYGLKAADSVKSLGTYVRAITWKDVTNGAKRATRAIGTFGRGITSNLGKGIDKTILGIGKGISTAFSGAAGIFDKLGSAVGGAVGQLGELGRTGWLAVAVFAVAAPLIGLVAGLIAGLPSLLAAAGAGFAAIALGMDGIKKAASVFGPSVDKLKATLSATFEKGLTPVFKQLNKIFPTLQTGLNQVAQGLIPLAQGFTNVVTSASGMKQIQDILSNTGKFFASLQPMISAFTQTFLTLGQIGSQSFGVLAGVLNDFAIKFDQVVSGLAASGVLPQVFQSLGQVVGSLLDLFTRLFEAGVTAMAQLGGPLTTLINGIADVLVALMPTLTTLSSLLANVLGAALSALAPAITALTPSIQLLGSLLGDLLVGAVKALAPVIEPLAKILNSVLLVALQAIQPIIPPLVDFMVQLGTAIGGALTQALTIVSPLLLQIGQFLTQVLTALLPLLPAILQLVQAGLTLFITVLAALVPPLLNVAQQIFPLLVQAIQMAVPIVTQIIQAFLPFVPMLAGIAQIILGVAIPAMNLIMSVVQAVWPAIQGIIQGVLNVILGIINTVLGILTGDWSRAWDGMKQILSGAWNAIKSAVQGGINGVVAFVRGLPGAILSALGNVGNLLWGAGRAILDGLLNGLKSAWNAVAGWVSNVAGWIKNLKGPLPYDRKLLIPEGKAIMAGLHEGLETNFATVTKLVSGMAGQIASTFDGSSVGTAWADSIKDGTPDAVKSVQDLVGAVSRSAALEFRGSVEADDFGSIEDRVAEALAGWGVQIDANGLAKLVNKANVRKARRG